MSFGKTHGAAVIRLGSPRPAETPGLPGTMTDPRPFAGFGYLFADARPFPQHPGTAAALDALADAMTAQRPGLTPMLAAFGKVIEEDIGVGAGREAPVPGDSPGVPRSRAVIAAMLENRRDGSLSLDSVYGEAGAAGFAHQFRDALREGERHALDAPARQRLPLLHGIAEPPQRAWVPEAPSDSRAGAGLTVAELQLALMRLHTAVADARRDEEEAGFAAVRREVTHTFQWLVLNRWLAQVCEPDTLAEVLRDEAPVYAAFRESVPDEGALPIPLEFSAAAFRFTDAPGRAGPEGPPDPAEGSQSPATAPLGLLFGFTRNARDRLHGAAMLPESWIIAWSEATDADPERADRPAASAHPVRASLPGGRAVRFTLHARRTLRHGLALNLPSAQTLMRELRRAGVALKPLTPDQIAGGATAAAARAGGFDRATPLWFYVMREADVHHGGERLGPLGSRIVAETLAGLVLNDPASYWHVAGSGPGRRWSPWDGSRPGGAAITSLGALLRAAGGI